jgi:hypothetical protein
MDLNPTELQTLGRIQEAGFSFIAFPMYANYVGVRRDDCACLLAPTGDSSFRIYVEPSWLISGNLTVRVTRDGRSHFVWKKQSLEATTERMAELRAFAESLQALLHPPAT